jgi:hypothetical protein
MTVYGGLTSPTFDQWMRAVNAIVRRRLGVNASDLADRDWRQDWRDELTPAEAVAEAIDSEF